MWIIVEMNAKFIPKYCNFCRFISEIKFLSYYLYFVMKIFSLKRGFPPFSICNI